VYSIRQSYWKRAGLLTLISRYILRETFAAWLIVVAVLFSILMSNQFAEILGDAAADRLPREAVFSIFSLTSLRYLTTIAPIALFLGIMLALARLHRDREAAALSACGVGPGRLLVPIMGLTLALAAVISWLALVETPEAVRRIEEIKFAARESLELGVLESGRFTTPDAGKTVLYARHVVGEEIHDVFLQRRQGDRIVAILAERGERIANSITGALSFVLYNGRRYEGAPGESEFLVAEFEEHGIPIRGDSEEELVEVVEGKPTAALLASSDPVDRAELQWRLSVPVSMFVLAVLAVPLSRSSPREGRFARLGIGLLIYITYANALAIARIWVERELVPEWVGLWWVHILLGGVALLLLGRESGWLARAPRVAEAHP
jgi:lipopolysaccharide export system permease protein